MGSTLLVFFLLLGCDTSPVGPPTPVFTSAEAPAGTSAVAVSESRIDVSWRDNSSNETGFEVHRSTAGASGAFVPLASTGGGVTSYSDVGLTAAAQYCYEVRAFQTIGRKTSYSPFSATECATTPSLPKPGSMQVKAVTTGADLDQDGYGLAVFRIRYGGGAFELVASMSVPANGTVAISGLTETGDYRLELTPAFGGSPVAPNCAVTSPNPLNVTFAGATTVEFDVACAPITQLAFADTAGGNPDIYVIYADGTGRTRLTLDPARDVEPAWSPDGRKVVFTSDRDGNAEIYVMNADGTTPVRLTYDATGDHTPTWSRDGRIAFVSERNGNTEIYVMNADGTSPVNLTNHPAGDGDPAWSPDGEKIAFVSDRDGNAGIYVMNADGSGVTRLAGAATSDELGGQPVHEGVAGPAWSPDGATIAFSRVVWNPEMGPTPVIFLMTADGSEVRQLTAAEYHSDPAWYPDGRTIAFVSKDDYYFPSAATIQVMRLDGTNRWAGVPLTSGFDPAWRR